MQKVKISPKWNHENIWCNFNNPQFKWRLNTTKHSQNQKNTKQEPKTDDTRQLYFLMAVSYWRCFCLGVYCLGVYLSQLLKTRFPRVKYDSTMKRSEGSSPVTRTINARWTLMHSELWNTPSPISRWTNDKRPRITCGSTTVWPLKQSFGKTNPSHKPIKLSPQSSYKCGFNAPPARARRPCCHMNLDLRLTTVAF